MTDTLRHDIFRLAGSDSSEYLMTKLTEQEYSLTATAERGIALDLIEKLYYMRLDYDTKMKSTADFDKKKTHEIPDRNIMLALKVSIAPIYCSSQVSLAKRPADSTTLLSSATRSATLTSAEDL